MNFKKVLSVLKNYPIESFRSSSCASCYSGLGDRRRTEFAPSAGTFGQNSQLGTVKHCIFSLTNVSSTCFLLSANWQKFCLVWIQLIPQVHQPFVHLLVSLAVNTWHNWLRSTDRDKSKVGEPWTAPFIYGPVSHVMGLRSDILISGPGRSALFESCVVLRSQSVRYQTTG